MRNYKLERLKKGETFITTEVGNSMIPLIFSRQEHELTPVINLTEIKVGDIVYCKCNGRFYTHLVTAIDSKKGFLISNNHGNNNGWTRQIFGKVTKVL